MRFLTSLIFVLSAVSLPAAEKMNVLFIAVDDLKPTLACYGDPIAKTPNIDRLAARGTTYTRAYCQQAVCNPSRVAVMTSLRPETTAIYDLETFFRDVVPDVVTLSELFINHGYHAERTGKIYHAGHGITDDPQSWSVVRKFPIKPRYGPAEEADVLKRKREAKAAGIDIKHPKNSVRGQAWSAPDIADDELRDGQLPKDAAAMMDLAKAEGKPFFAAVGFLNPHLPFVSPKKYWDLYSKEEIQSQIATYRTKPSGAPDYGVHSWGELRKYHKIPAKGPLSEEQEFDLVHGYYAAVSYVDACVGQLLDELDARGIAENTAIVLWGDHGWHLGDHGIYCKHTNYEQAARVPMIVSLPGQENPGEKNDALVELVDLYPTLATAAGLPLPDHVEGSALQTVGESQELSYHLYPRFGKTSRLMGHAVRSERYRLVNWHEGAKTDAIEFYDYETDPLETKNLARDRNYQREVAYHLQRARQGWRTQATDASGDIEMPEKENLHLYLLAGQSNMAGRGDLDERSHEVDERVLAMNRAGDWTYAVEPLHFDKTAAGAGLGKSFGEAVAAESDQAVTVGLVPTAWGGSPITSWEPGAEHEQTQSHPWDEAIVRAKKAMESGELKGIVWHQGESDSKPGEAEQYEKRLTNLIARFRNELNAPELPFIIGQMAKLESKPWSSSKSLVDQASQNVADADPNVHFVNSDELTLRDEVHFDTESLREFGERYAAAFSVE